MSWRSPRSNLKKTSVSVIEISCKFMAVCSTAKFVCFVSDFADVVADIVIFRVYFLQRSKESEKIEFYRYLAKKLHVESTGKVVG